MLPPMMYRIVDPAANFEQAYVLACKYALPDGLIGLMIAAMFSATVSTVDAELNVFAGILTKDFYKQIWKKATEKSQVFVGRALTLLLGAMVTWLAILVPAMGGAEDIVLSITALVAGLTVLPVLWGMFSKKITQKGIFAAIFITGFVFIIVKYGFLNSDGWFISELPGVWQTWILTYTRTIEAVTGAVLPFIVLAVIEFSLKKESSHYIEINQYEENAREEEMQSSLFPAKVMAVTFAVLAIVLAFLAVTEINEAKPQWVLSVSLFLIASLIWFSIKRIEKQRKLKENKSI
jgi:Na+/proline symporter